LFFGDDFLGVCFCIYISFILYTSVVAFCGFIVGCFFFCYLTASFFFGLALGVCLWSLFFDFPVIVFLVVLFFVNYTINVKINSCWCMNHANTMFATKVKFNIIFEFGGLGEISPTKW